MGMSIGQLAGLAVTAIAVWTIATLTVAGRSLNRLQRRAWAEEPRPDEEEVNAGGSSVESAFIALGMTRQLALVAFVVQAVGLMIGAGSGVLAALGACIAAYLLLDKLLPYWTVALIGSRRILAVGGPVSAALRFLLRPVADYLSRTAGRARDREELEEESTEPRDFGAFLDLAEEEGVMGESEEALLRGFADFEEAIVREVMTPRVDVVSIEASATLGDLRDLIAEHRLSRIPVVKEDLDHVAGVVNLKDLVAALAGEGEESALEKIVRPAWFVPETKRVRELLQEFQQRQIQLAIVVDEYGGTAGVVTLEDVLEEIVGEIQDESEEPESLIQSEGAGIVASGKAEVEDVEEALSVQVPEGEYHTVGGMVFTHLGHVPETGECFEYGGLRIEVLEADDRRIHRVRIDPR